MYHKTIVMNIKLLIVNSLILFFALQSKAQNCKDISTYKDSRTGVTKHETPLSMDIKLIKSVNPKDTGEAKTSYFIYLQVLSPNVRSNQKGCKIVLSDSTVLNFPEQMVLVDQMTSFGGRNIHKYSATVPLTYAEIKKIEENSISNFWVFVQESTVSKLIQDKKFAKNLKRQITCLINAQ